MPKVRVKMNTPAEDSLLKAKKRVASLNKRKYRGTDDAAMAAAAVAVGATSGMTDAIVSKLTDIRATVNEIASQLNLTAGQNAPWASKAIDRYISASSNLRKQVSDLNAYLDDNAGQLQNLNDADVAQIASVYQEVTMSFQEITENLSKENPKRQQALKKVFAVFVPDLARLTETLVGKVLSQSSSGIKVPTISAKPFPAEAQSNPEQIPEDQPAWKGNKAYYQSGARAGTLRPATPKKKAAGGDPDLTGVAEMMEGKGFSHPVFRGFASGGALVFGPARRGVGVGVDACGRHAGTRFYGAPCGVGGGEGVGLLSLAPYMPTRFL